MDVDVALFLSLEVFVIRLYEGLKVDQYIPCELEIHCCSSDCFVEISMISTEGFGWPESLCKWFRFQIDRGLHYFLLTDFTFESFLWQYQEENLTFFTDSFLDWKIFSVLKTDVSVLTVLLGWMTAKQGQLSSCMELDGSGILCDAWGGYR